MSKTAATPVSNKRTEFDEFCKNSYTRESYILDETISKETAERVVRVIKEKPTFAVAQDPFYNWVKRKGFTVTFGLREALCVPVVPVDPDLNDVSKLWKQVAVVEDFYDIITKFHCGKSGHLSTETTFNELNKEYEGIPFSAVKKYIELCQSCHLNKSNTVVKGTGRHACNKSEHFMKKGQIEVIDLSVKPWGSFPIVCLYIDVYSNYHILFPLGTSENIQMDIAIKLRRNVFPYFGVPCYLYSSIGYEFIDTLLEYTHTHWPDTVITSNGCKKVQQRNSILKRARKSKMLITELFENCQADLEGIQLTTSSCADLLLSIQYQLNTTTSKSSCKSAYELVFGIPPQDTSCKQLIDISETSSNEEILDSSDEEWIDLSSNKSKRTINRKNSSETSRVEMNRLMQKSSSQQQPSQKIQQMLSLSSIQAQEQQVTSLRELLRQEENRLEMLKKMRSSSPGSKPSKVPSELTQRSAVIRSSETGHHLSNGSQPAMSARLQKLVDSVAIDQMNSKYNNSLNQKSGNKQTKNSSSPEVITIADSPSPASPPALISTNSVPGVIQGPSNRSSSPHTIKLDEALIMKSIENSRRYREFMMKQNNLKRNFQRQMDKKMAGFPYPKTFRQVWPIIPVQDPSFVKNLGLETVTQFFDQGAHTKSPSSSKVKPICNQCGCDFASAWQIRKNNSKQVLLCESCDFTNLKLLQRTKLATQLKEVVESVRKEDEKFNNECDEARKQIVAAERTAVIKNAQKSLNNSKSSQWQQKTSSDGVTQSVVPSILPATKGSPSEVKIIDARKRRSDQDYVVPQRKSTKIASPQVDHTLNRITQHLIRKQVDEKVQRHRRHRSPVVSTTRTLPLDNMEVIISTPQRLSEVMKTLPPPLTSVGDSRRSRRKGQPRQNRQLSSSSDI